MSNTLLITRLKAKRNTECFNIWHKEKWQLSTLLWSTLPVYLSIPSNNTLSLCPPWKWALTLQPWLGWEVIKLWDLCERGGRRIVRSRGVKGFQEDSIFHTQQDRCTRNYRGCHSTLKTCTVLPRQGPAERKRSGHKVPPLTKKLFVINTCSERENQLPPTECHWLYQPHSRAGLMQRSDQYKMDSMLLCMLFLLQLIGFCFVFSFIFLVLRENMNQVRLYELRRLREGEVYEQNIFK